MLVNISSSDIISFIILAACFFSFAKMIINAEEKAMELEYENRILKKNQVMTDELVKTLRERINQHRSGRVGSCDEF